MSESCLIGQKRPRSDEKSTKARSKRPKKVKQQQDEEDEEDMEMIDDGVAEQLKRIKSSRLGLAVKETLRRLVTNDSSLKRIDIKVNELIID